MTSAGLLDDGNRAAAHSVDLLAERGVDISGHRSTTMTAEALRASDLVLGMAREHVREAVVLVPAAFPKSYTLKELVRRGESLGPRHADEPIADYLERVHAGRSSRDLMGSSPADDIADPIGLPRSAYQRMVDELDPFLDRLVRLIWAHRLESVA